MLTLHKSMFNHLITQIINYLKIPLTLCKAFFLCGKPGVEGGQFLPGGDVVEPLKGSGRRRRAARRAPAPGPSGRGRFFRRSGEAQALAAVEAEAAVVRDRPG